MTTVLLALGDKTLRSACKTELQAAAFQNRSISGVGQQIAACEGLIDAARGVEASS